MNISDELRKETEEIIRSFQDIGADFLLAEEQKALASVTESGIPYYDKVSRVRKLIQISGIEMDERFQKFNDLARTEIPE